MSDSRDHPIARLAKTLDLGNHRKPCPYCGHGCKDTALSITIERDSATVWNCFRCGNAGAIHTDNRTLARAMRPAKAAKLTRTYETLSPKCRALWATCEPVRGSLAETYLQSRNCVIPAADADLRFTPSAYHWRNQSRHPAMVALVTDFADANVWRTLHFTFLRHDGTDKADVTPAKLLLPKHAKKHGVIRLFHDAEVSRGLALCEGIETALSAAHIFTPVFATVDAGNMAALPVIEGIDSISIFADNDSAGLKAASELAQRWLQMGREVFIKAPIDDGADVNDILSAGTQ